MNEYQQNAARPLQLQYSHWILIVIGTCIGVFLKEQEVWGSIFTAHENRF
jgi:hypothetical protein